MDIAGRAYAGAWILHWLLRCVALRCDGGSFRNERRIDLVISEDEREDVDCEIVLARM